MAGKERYGSRANHYRAVKFCKRTRENSFKSAILKKSGFLKTELREEEKTAGWIRPWTFPSIISRYVTVAYQLAPVR